MLRRLLLGFAAAGTLTAGGMVSFVDSAAAWKVGNWTGAAYRSNQTGRFSFCQMWVRYNSGIWLYFRQYPSYNLYVGMARQNWTLKTNGRYIMAFFIDGRFVRRARGIVEPNNTRRIWLALGTDRCTRHRLRRGFHLTLVNNNQRYRFRLTATSVGLNALERCVNANRHR